MSDYLSTLVVRTVNPAGGIRPRLVSLFEPPYGAGGRMFGHTSRDPIGGSQTFDERAPSAPADRPFRPRPASRVVQLPMAAVPSVHEIGAEPTGIPAEPSVPGPQLQDQRRPLESIGALQSVAVMPEPLANIDAERLRQPASSERPLSLKSATPERSVAGPLQQSGPRSPLQPPIRAVEQLDVERVRAVDGPQPQSLVLSHPHADEHERSRMAEKRQAHIIALREGTPTEAPSRSSPATVAAQPHANRLVSQRVVAEQGISQAVPQSTIASHVEPLSLRTTHASPLSIIVQPEVTPYARKAETAAAEPVKLDAAPTVQVTIGRVEVRAMLTPAAPSRRERPTPAVMGLDEYLRRRAGPGSR